MAVSTLQEAYQLIKRGQRNEAQRMLQHYLDDYPDNPKGWWLMAHATTDTNQRIDCLERVLDLDPSYPGAQEKLQKLQGTAFTFDDVYESSAPSRSSAASKSQSPKSKKNNDRMMIIAGVSMIALALLALSCGLMYRAASNGLEGMLTTLSENVTIEGGSSSGSGSGVFSGHESMWDIRRAGSIAVGQTVNGNVDTFDDDGWTLTVDSRRQVTVDVVSTSGLDPEVFFYDDSGRLVAENDDIDFMNNNTNSRVTINCPPGQYGIVVSAFGSGGSYRLSVR